MLIHQGLEPGHIARVEKPYTAALSHTDLELNMVAEQ